MKISSINPESTILEELGRRLASIRKQKGFSQTRLADEAGIGVATLRRIEGGHDSQMESWLKILKALNMISAVDTLLPENYRSPMADVMKSSKEKKSKSRSAASNPWQDGEEK